MENPCIKKGLGVIVLILFLSTTCLPIVNASEGKPDLIVQQMGFARDEETPVFVSYAIIKNIGDLKVVEDLYLKYTFTRLIYKTITNIDTTWMWIGGGLEPGEEVHWDLISDYRLPKFGFFEFKCTVNPDKIIEESNYDNNDLSQKYIAFLGQWREIG
jgi:hypothetical protein